MLPYLLATWPLALVLLTCAGFRWHQRGDNRPRRDADLDRVVREFAGRRRGVSFLHNGGALQHDR